MGQVGQVGHGISTTLHTVIKAPVDIDIWLPGHYLSFFTGTRRTSCSNYLIGWGKAVSV